jgi:hypothetical protein
VAEQAAAGVDEVGHGRRVVDEGLPLVATSRVGAEAVEDLVAGDVEDGGLLRARGDAFEVGVDGRLALDEDRCQACLRGGVVRGAPAVVVHGHGVVGAEDRDRAVVGATDLGLDVPQGLLDVQPAVEVVGAVCVPVVVQVVTADDHRSADGRVRRRSESDAEDQKPA